MDIEVIKKLIEEHTTKHADMIVRSLTAERYYRNKNDILFKPKDPEEDTENPLRNADNRIPSNFHGLLVNQKASYMFTAPPLFDVGDKSANDAITEALGDYYAKACKDLCINASNSGVSWLHLWVNEEKKLEYGVVDSKQIIPIWSSSLNKKLIAALRVYDDTDDNGDTYNVYEYWTDAECYAYKKVADSTLDEGLTAYNMFYTFVVDKGMGDMSDNFTHDFGEVPFIPFFNNNIKNSDLDNIKKHIDVYDKVYSGFVNDLEDIQELIFILTNYEGSDLKTFLSDLKKYKTVKLESAGADDRSGLETLTIDIPIEAREKLLTITRKAIYEQGQGVDPDPQKFGGDSSGIALEYFYSPLELKAGLMETEFKLGFGRFIRMICKYINTPVKSIIQTWTRTKIRNEAALVDIAKNSVGVISQQTILKNHPWVEDAEAEKEQIDKETAEENKKLDDYSGNFVKTKANKGSDVVV